VILGCDISQYQGAIPAVQWQAIASDKRFVYLRAGVGNDPPDITFAANAANARAAGLIVGAYNFVYPLPPDSAHTGRDPESQAQLHFQACAGLGSANGDLPIAVDLEWPVSSAWPVWGCSAAQIVEWVVRYMAKTLSLFGRAPLLYTYPDFVAQLGHPAALGAYPLWLASYQPVPDIPAPWTSCVMQQTNDGGYTLPNGGHADEDQCTEAAFAALLQ
jgi:lysozyme